MQTHDTLDSCTRTEAACQGTTQRLFPGSERRAGKASNSHLYGVAFLAIILYLPYFIPQSPVASDSYLFGYNNRAGVVLLLVLAVGTAIWKKGYGLKLRPAGLSTNICLSTLGVCLAVQLAACAAMVLVAGRFGGFRESSYEIDRVWLLAQGKIPYVGFEWPFGALFLYGPLWLSHVLKCSIADGYYVFWTLASLAGVALLFATINRLDYPTPRKNSIFVILFVAYLPSVLGMGTHYTWLRFITPLYFILVIHKMSARDSRPDARRLAAALAVCFTALLLLISPEMAVAHCFACCVLLFPRKSAVSPGALPTFLYLGMLAALAVLFTAAVKLHLLDTLLASGGGADSFPITLSAPVVCFFAMVFISSCAMVRRWNMRSLNDNSVAMIVVSLPLLPAALGRCDPGHILCNGVGFFLAVFLYASPSPRMWRLCRNAFLIVMIALPAFTVFRYVFPQIFRTAMRTAGEESVPGNTGLRAVIARFGIRHMPASAFKDGGLVDLARLRLRVVPATVDFGLLYPGVNFSQSEGLFEAPFGYKPNGFGSYLSSAVDYGYYEGIENANTPRAVQRKVDELIQHPYRDVLLPDPSGNLCRVDANGERHLITVLFFFPYTAQASHPISIRKPLCDYIANHYTLTRSAAPDNFGYELWSPNNRNDGGEIGD